MMNKQKNKGKAIVERNRIALAYMELARDKTFEKLAEEQKLKAKGDYDSLFAKGGVDLKNNEYIVYNDNQCTIKYIIELKS